MRGFANASDVASEGQATGVLKASFAHGIQVEDMCNDPSGFVSASFRGALMQWPIVDNQVFALMSTCRRLEYSL